MMRVHIYVSGRVQGVFYRSSTQKKARELSITGWVKNLEDGRVEIVAEGEEDKLKKFIEWCRIGPVMARVEDFEVRVEPVTGEFKSFDIKV
ncbi:acylphosphatase [Candidatus Bathyarchaeota archaeon]|nr:acylphosphatase [Candidatus Bathyarchaeota archaeon]MBS7630396.1 acylphosphatase [Candidatus Bathyarchaeota archaeon]